MGINRQSGIELLRLLLLFFIVMHHGLVHGLGLDYLSPWKGEMVVSNNEVPFLAIINFFIIFAVNCFVLISGYFSVKSSYKKIITLLTRLLFYTVCFTTIPWIVEGDYHQAVRSLFVLSNGRYWFVTYYLILIVISPLLNVYTDKANKREMIVLLGGMLFASCYLGFIWGDKINDNGYTFLQFVLMYCIGRSVRLNKVVWKPSFALSVYCTSVLINVALFFIAFHLNKVSIVWKLTYYNNPLVIISSVAFFLLFLRLNFRSRVINWLSSSSFSIYLISCSLLLSHFYYRIIKNMYYNLGIWGGVFSVLYMSILICIVSIMIDKVHQIMFHWWYKRWR